MSNSDIGGCFLSDKRVHLGLNELQCVLSQDMQIPLQLRKTEDLRGRDQVLILINFEKA